MIQRDCVMEFFISVCPSFKEKWEEHIQDIWNRDSESILYTDFSALARHLTSLAERESYQEFGAIFDKIEFLLHVGDSFVREAVVAGLLEDFQTGLLNIKYDLNTIERYLKPETKKYWIKLIKFWNGEIPILIID